MIEDTFAGTAIADVRSAFTAAIRTTLGFAPNAGAIIPGRFVRFSTRERGPDDAGYAKLYEDQQGGVFGDMRTGIFERWTAQRNRVMSCAQRIELVRAIEASKQAQKAQQRAKWTNNRALIAHMLDQTVPIERGDPVARYLAGRGLDLWPLPSCLRVHRGLSYFDGGNKIGVFPAMIAPVISVDGSVVTLHRTYVTDEGRKAPVASPKKLMPANGPLSGAAIPLGRPKAGVVGIAEGIETALAVRCASNIPTVAAYCASNLASWCWPAGARHIMIFSDNDAAGHNAATKLMRRAVASRIGVQILTPSTAGADWADVWAQREMTTAEGVLS